MSFFPKDTLESETIFTTNVQQRKDGLTHVQLFHHYWWKLLEKHGSYWKALNN